MKKQILIALLACCSFANAQTPVFTSADINPGKDSSNPGTFTKWNDKMVFRAYSKTTGAEPYITDGTPAGTTLIKDVATGAGDSYPYYFMPYKKRLYFVAMDAGGNKHIWKTDGTSANTVKVAPTTAINPDPVYLSLSNTLYYNPTDSSVYFAANYTGIGRELWSMKDTSTPAAIHNTTVNNTFRIFPNPSDGAFTIQLSNTNYQHGSIAVYDVTGKIVYQQKEIPQTPIHKVKVDAPKGIYLLKLQLDDAIQTKQIVIE